MFDKLEKYFGKYRFFETLMHTKNYFGSYLLVGALGVISLPVYTLYLSPSEFGIVEVFSSLVKALIVISAFNIHASVGRYYYEEKKDFKEFLGTAMITMAGLVLLGFLAIWLARGLIFGKLNLPFEVSGYLFPAVTAGVLFSVFNQLYIPRKESMIVAKATITWAFGSFFFAVLFIWLMEPNYVGRIAGATVFFSLMGLFFLYRIIPQLKPAFSMTHLRYVFWISLPLMPTALSGFILNYLDQFFIISQEGQADAGLYSFAYKIGMLLFGFNSAIYNATLPDFFKFKNNGQQDEIRIQERSMMRFMILAAGFLVLFASQLGELLSSRDAFNIALPLIPLIVSGYLFLGLFSFYSRIIYHSNKNIYISVATLIAGIVNIVLNFIYIPIYGYEAAAYTTLLSYFVMFLLGWLITRFAIKGEKTSILTIGGFLLIFGIVYFLNFTVNGLLLSSFLKIVLKGIIFVALGSFLFWNKINTFIKDYIGSQSS